MFLLNKNREILQIKRVLSKIKNNVKTTDAAVAICSVLCKNTKLYFFSDSLQLYLVNHSAQVGLSVDDIQQHRENAVLMAISLKVEILLRYQYSSLYRLFGVKKSSERRGRFLLDRSSEKVSSPQGLFIFSLTFEHVALGRSS